MAQMVNVRVYHGIHFRFADTEATDGRPSKSAEYVVDHALLPISN